MTSVHRHATGQREPSFDVEANLHPLGVEQAEDSFVYRAQSVGNPAGLCHTRPYPHGPPSSSLRTIRTEGTPSGELCTLPLRFEYVFDGTSADRNHAV